ncbi:PadR family transcriptional regulator [Glaciibacter superstes]|uniref:PadR family transcriptional regulator n=1 Tax=Glaciibacter superstes TaxID=501023 RepID=UPI0003B5F2E2|nr:PadR family transcriptional regulator [Glaciibacter superstes]
MAVRNGTVRNGTVRNGLLSILTIGPAYGFQLHGELSSRTAGRRNVNVGQVYGTLERLARQGSIESAGSTDDGLPLYRLTAAGRAEASEWLTSTESAVGEEWNDLIDRVLLASSLPDGDALGLIAAYREHWLGVGGNLGASGQDRLAAGADQALATAALDWLEHARRLVEDGSSDSFRRDLSAVRPRRGRRPATASASGAPMSAAG